MRQSLIAIGYALSIAMAAPLAAQDASPSPDPERSEGGISTLSELLGGLFGAPETLNAEQEARLPAARSVALKLFPEGTYAKMMRETFAPVFERVLGSTAMAPGLQVMALTGLPRSSVAAIEEKQLQEAVKLLDPNASERAAEVGRVSANMMTDLISQIEPSYRLGLMRALAIRFTEAELRDLDTYFATPVGRKFAAQSSLIHSDPQVMSAMTEMTPKILEAMPSLFEDLGAISSKYPKGRTYSALSSSEQAELATLLNVSADQLAANEPGVEPQL